MSEIINSLEEKPKQEYRYFTYGDNHLKWASNFVLIASLSEGGYFINNSGEFSARNNDNKLNSDFRLERCIRNSNKRGWQGGQWKELKLKDALKLINLDARQKVCERLGIEMPVPIQITEEMKVKIIKYLRKHRATNGDAAKLIKGDKLELFETLAENKVIKVINGRYFYIEEEN